MPRDKRRSRPGEFVLGIIKDELSGIEGDQAKIDYMNSLSREIAKLSPLHGMPVSSVQWLPVSEVEPNDYNPNAVAPKEMKLLHTSISHDGYTQPVVVIYDPERGKHIIVDGFHRWSTCRLNEDIQERTFGRVPVVVMEKDINDRMASTVRHNRARGKHSIQGMGDMVFAMLDNGMKDAEVCNELGLEPEELIRLKDTTGFSYLFDGKDYNRAWVTKRMNELRREYDEGKNPPKPKQPAKKGKDAAAD